MRVIVDGDYILRDLRLIDLTMQLDCAEDLIRDSGAFDNGDFWEEEGVGYHCTSETFDTWAAKLAVEQKALIASHKPTDKTAKMNARMSREATLAREKQAYKQQKAEAVAKAIAERNAK